MKILVCGGRKYSDRRFLFSVLDRIHARRPITLVVEGGAEGADRLARAWALWRGIAFVTYPADWELYGKRAGRVRNSKMLREERPDLVVAFAGGSGTMHMVETATFHGTPVLRTWKYKTPLPASQLPTPSLASAV